MTDTDFSWARFYASGDLDLVLADLRKMERQEVAAKWGIPRRFVSSIVKAHLPELLHRRRKLPTCVVCGADIVVKDTSSHRDYLSGCGDPDCTSVMDLLPWMRRQDPNQEPPVQFPRNTGAPNYPYELVHYWLQEALDIDLEAHARACEATDSGKRLFKVVQDLRGIDRPEAQNDIWGELSRTTAAFRLVDTTGGAVAVNVSRRAGETTLEALGRLYVGGKDPTAYLMAFDVLIAWRCSCARASSFWWSPEDVPDEDGFHGACPVCGGVALKVETEE